MNISMNITMRDAHLDEVTFLNETLSSWLNETVDISDERINSRAVNLDLVFDPLNASLRGSFIGLAR